MSENEQLKQLREMLTGKLIRKRKAGIEMAREMLAQGIFREQVREMLAELVKKDLIMIVQEDAQKVLNEDDERRQSRPASSPDYIFGAVCPKGHTNYYDKREHCPKQSNITRRVVRRDSQELDEILVKCKTIGCDEEFYVEIKCEGYK